MAVSSDQTSYSAQASVLLTGKLSLSVRQETFEYDGKNKVLKGAYGQDKDSWLTVGIKLLHQRPKYKDTGKLHPER